ncbi:hypothetical protein [Nannocystis radixulma]|uniref:WG containing repeat-containing protein n=1 Tax=Nannocystis radixulma TaxID=2995305 RepID=A0ABT5BJ75_9BACT|nr:hypothetical protein [Nannocystis radixulma]MDC0674209.1 hypothetical protein [Nannocystis radixulma]
MFALAMLVGPGCAANEPPTARAEGARAECYSLAAVPPLGIPEEVSQSFVDLDEDGRVLLDAIPAEDAHSIGKSMQTAFVWAGGEPQAITFDGFFQTHALDMNERGEVLVFASPMAGWVPPWTDAFVWKDGHAVAQIPAPSGRQFQYGWINELGHVALSTAILPVDLGEEPVPPRASLWRDGEVVELGEGEVHAINDADEIVGFDSGAGAVVRWRGSEREELPTLCDSPLTGSTTVLLDAQGRVAALIECEGAWRTMLWEGYDVRELPKLGGAEFRPQDMNDHGEIVGYVYVDVDERFVPALWDGDELVELPLPNGATNGVAENINNQGVLIGQFEDGFFVGSAAGTRALPLDLSWEVLFVGRINERGDIANSVAGEHGYSETTLLWRPTNCEDGTSEAGS